jgi:hypothetical protein
MRITIKESFEKAPAHVVGKPRIIDHNTFRYTTPDGRDVIRLHITDIIEHLPDGKIKVTSGGWKTHTTSERLNNCLPDYRFFSDRGVWKVSRDGVSVPFYDGMVLPDALVEDSARRIAEAKGESQRKLKDAIKKFVAKTLPTGKPIPKPDNGDCWYCLMFDREEPVPEGVSGYNGPAGTKPARQRDSEHLRNHVMDGYMTGSLVVNAYRDAGYTDNQIGYVVYGFALDHKRVRRQVARYLNKRLGLPF